MFYVGQQTFFPWSWYHTTEDKFCCGDGCSWSAEIFLWIPKSFLPLLIWFIVSSIIMVSICTLYCLMWLFYLSGLFFKMKITVFVPFTVLIPWDNCPSSFAKYRSQIFLSGPSTRCLFFWAIHIWWVTALDSLPCRNCDSNEFFLTRLLLKLYLKLELGPPVSTLGGCAGRTLGGGLGTSGIIMCGTEGDMWTLRWIYVGLCPSSSSMMLGRSEGIYLASVGCTLWGILSNLVTGCCCGGSKVWCRLAATLEKIRKSYSIATIWESPMLENGAWGAGFCRVWSNLFAAMMIFSEA